MENKFDPIVNREKKNNRVEVKERVVKKAGVGGSINSNARDNKKGEKGIPRISGMRFLENIKTPSLRCVLYRYRNPLAISADIQNKIRYVCPTNTKLEIFNEP